MRVKVPILALDDQPVQIIADEILKVDTCPLEGVLLVPVRLEQDLIVVALLVLGGVNLDNILHRVLDLELMLLVVEDGTHDGD